MIKILDRFFGDNNLEEEYVKIRQKSSSRSAYIVGLVAAMGGFLYGYDTGLINDILEMSYVKAHFPKNGDGFNVHERAIITAVLSLGTFCGSITAPLVSDNYGRRFSIILSAGLVFTVGTILQIAANEIPLLCVGRYISGIAVGNLSAIVPLYQAEASPKWVRGSVVYLYQWAITWGLLVASAVCQGTRRLQNSGSYRIPIGLQFIFTIILCGGMLFLPESPRYFVQKNQLEKALNSISKLRKIPSTDPDLIEELVEIKASYDYEMSFSKTKWIDCFKNGGGRHKQVLRMMTGMGVHMFQQASGINFIFYYGVNFFSSTGVGNYYLMSFITYVVNTAFTIPGIILIEIIGRRKLLLIGGVGMSFSNFVIGIIGVTVGDKEINSMISVSFSCCFIAFFAASWGGCVWALTSDLYGISIRQKAISITASTNWIVNFVCAFITPYLIDTGDHTAALGNRIFFIWGGLNALGTLFVYLIVYETKGLRLEEVDYMYKVCNSPKDSTRFESTKINYENFTPYQTGNFPPEPARSLNQYGSDNDDEGSDGPNDTGSTGDDTPQNEKSEKSANTKTSSHSPTNSNTDSHGNDPDESPSVIANIKGLTLVPYMNQDLQSISSSISDERPRSDYDRYLESLKSNFSKYESSQTSTSFVNHSKEYDLKNTVIAAPFFNSPPSDSSSEEAESESGSDNINDDNNDNDNDNDNDMANDQQK